MKVHTIKIVMHSCTTRIMSALRRLPALVALVVCWQLTGCGGNRETQSAKPTFGSSPRPDSTIEAGVVFLSTENYLCYPLSRFGIQQPADIVSIDTSCECLVADVVQFASVSDNSDNGLMLKFLADSSESEPRTYSLAARVTLHLRDQTQKEITVRFLHTLMIEKKSA